MAESIGGQQLGIGIEGQSGTGGYSPGARNSQNQGATESPGAGEAHKSYENAKRSAADSYAHARQTIADLGGQAQRAASDWTQHTRADTEDYVRGNPWSALGIAAGIGILVGLMLRR